MNIKLTDKFE